jgi:sporulation protein YlmC with PRC-barrel domain
MAVLSTSSLTGNAVVNLAGEDLGKITDFMLDTDSGEVVYAVLSFGGFLGMGDKLFAVPLEAMRLDTENHRFMIDLDKERLENAPGFDKDHWPRTADHSFEAQVYDYYGVPARRGRRV